MECPACKSHNIDRLRDSSSGRIVKGASKPLVRCVTCGEIFAIPETEFAALPAGANLDVGEQISESTPCGNCGYNLKFMLVGGKCPECGAPIRSPALMPSKKDPAPRLYHILNAAGALCLVGGGALWRFANCGLPTLLLCATVGFYTIGANHIWHKRALDLVGFSEIRGRAAIGFGIAFIVLWTIVLALLVVAFCV